MAEVVILKILPERSGRTIIIKYQDHIIMYQYLLLCIHDPKPKLICYHRELIHSLMVTKQGLNYSGKVLDSNNRENYVVATEHPPACEE